MKKRTLQYLLLLPLMYISIGVMAQTPSPERARQVKLDSLMTAEENSKNLSDLETKKTNAEQKADEAARVESDAKGAAREAQEAYRTEKKAQKARDKADKQAKKAAKARAKSDKNED